MISSSRLNYQSLLLNQIQRFGIRWLHILSGWYQEKRVGDTITVFKLWCGRSLDYFEHGGEERLLVPAHRCR